jgi:hypothetical protein
MTTTVIPFSLWTVQGPEADLLAQAELPHLRAWLAQSQRTQVVADAEPTEGRLATFTPPHERVLASAQGWPLVDGCLPWAAQAAAAQGLDASKAWAFVTLCNWHVSNGQVTLGDPAHLDIDANTNAVLFQAMHTFFAEDGMALHPYRNGVWLAQSELFENLPTASLDRVIGRNIDPWLVGHPVLRRLQNEMQMLLYTHAVNDGRALTINSLWWHGAGALPTVMSATASGPCHVPDALCVAALRAAALQQDLVGWLEAWQAVDAQVIQPLLQTPAAHQSLVLCGDSVAHVHEAMVPSWWRSMMQKLKPMSMNQVIGVCP